MEIEIPILPRGKTVQLYILSTWGDKNYVGLNGIEFWNREGKVTNSGIFTISTQKNRIEISNS